MQSRSHSNRPLELPATRVVGDADREVGAARGTNLKIVDLRVDDGGVGNRHERAFGGSDASTPKPDAPRDTRNAHSIPDMEGRVYEDRDCRENIRERDVFRKLRV